MENNYNNNNSLQLATKQITDTVLKAVDNMTKNNGLILPKGYNPTNALKSAYLKLVENDLLDTDKNALASALLNMCIQGLNPAKNQCYFIKYNNKVTLMRSYFGDRTSCLNSGLVKDIQAHVIYEGDKVDLNYDEGYLKVNHQTSFENMDKPIKGAYAVAVLPDGSRLYDIMTIDRIKKSWAMSKNFGEKNKFQNSFSDDACMRTVIRHLVKNIFNQSCEDNATIDSYCKTTADEYDNEKDNPNGKDFTYSTNQEVRAKQVEQTASQEPPIDMEEVEDTMPRESDFDY